jgi:hypothetical protein
MIYNRSILIVFVLVTFFCCTPKVDLEIEKQAILSIHHAQRAQHFQKDTMAFVDQFSDNYISVNNGIISSPSRKESIERFGSYFSSVDFIKWDDVSDPIIQMSLDGTMANTIVDKEVIVSYRDTSDQIKKDTTFFAWSAIYRKYDNEWKIDCVTSTNQ